MSANKCQNRTVVDGGLVSSSQSGWLEIPLFYVNFMLHDHAFAEIYRRGWIREEASEGLRSESGSCYFGILNPSLEVDRVSQSRISSRLSTFLGLRFRRSMK